MLMHKTKTRVGQVGGTVSGFYLFAIIAFILVAVFVFMIRFGNSTDSTAASVYKTYQSNGFSLNYPSNWSVLANTSAPGVTTFTSPVPSPSEGGLVDPRSYRSVETASSQTFSKLDVLSFDIPSGMAARDFMYSRSTTPLVGKMSDVTVNGVGAVRLEYDSADLQSNHTLSQTYTNIFLTKGNKGYIIAGFADPEVMNQIINSFKAE